MPLATIMTNDKPACKARITLAESELVNQEKQLCTPKKLLLRLLLQYRLTGPTSTSTHSQILTAGAQ